MSLEIVAMPRAPKAVLGVADYREIVVPVIDLRERFALPPAPMSRKTKWNVPDVAPPRLGALASGPRSALPGPPSEWGRPRSRGGFRWGRGGQPGELANVALFLARDQASYVNGQAIAVDGGLSSSHPVTRQLTGQTAV